VDDGLALAGSGGVTAIKNLWIPVAAGLLLTVLFYLLGAFLSGGGHSLVAMTIFFPYSLAAGLWLEDGPSRFIEIVLVALQFPVYALILANVRGGPRRTAALILLAAHVIAAIIGLRMYRASKGEFGMGDVNVPRATR
jgi:hypothetical protein